jgi:general secretion pathway protein K
MTRRSWPSETARAAATRHTDPLLASLVAQVEGRRFAPRRRAPRMLPSSTPSKSGGEAMRRSRTRKHFSRRGVALIAVSAILTILTVTTMQFRYDTNVDYASAANARDAMRAEFLARSIMNMSTLAIRVQTQILDKARRQLAQFGLPDVQIGDFMSMLEVPMCGSKDELAGMASLASVDSGGIKGLGIDYGQCHVESFTAEDGKINVNCANAAPATANRVAAELTALVSSPAYDRMFEERDGDGQFTDRQTFVKAIMDWVDRDEAMFGTSGAAEDYGYEALKQPYHAKNNYIDSVDELQMVRGMDDKRWALFGPELTVYGECKINVSATQSPLQMMALLVQAAKDPNDPVLQNPVKLFLLAQRVAQARSFGAPFDSLQTFTNFVQDPDAALGLKLGAQGQPGGVNAMGMPSVDGLVLDPKKLGDVATVGPRRIYRVVAAAQVGRVEKRITGVFDVKHQNQNRRDTAPGVSSSPSTGAWVYWRVE